MHGSEPLPADLAGNICELDAVFAENAPKIDGFIEEDIWSRGALATNFTQREPNYGDRLSERVGVRVLYDHSNLYLLFICGDTEPERMVAQTMRRDQSLYNDDYVEVYLDPLHDHRTVFLFQTNALGAKKDAIVTSEGKNFNDDWDGIWHVKTMVTSQGWVAEMAIPLETLRYNKGDQQTWGINFGRSLQRNIEDGYWAPIDFTGNFREKYRAGLYGHLNNLSLSKSSRTVRLKPYALGGIERDFEVSSDYDVTREIGADAKYGITNQLTLDLTYNTDFAQVEADDEVVNLSRFSLFFPEKREFFLEGAGIFNFSASGALGGGLRGGRDMLLFHSRTIGLQNKQPVPLHGGARLQGKVGNYDVGVLNITGKETAFTDGDETTITPATNFSVLRARRNFGGRSDVGVLMTNRTNGHREDNNKAVGFDTNIYFPHDIIFSGYYARTFSPDLNNSNNSLFTSLGYRDPLIHGYVNYLRVERNFNPGMGYIQRDDINKLLFHLGIGPRPRKFNIRSIRNEFSGTYIADQRFSMLERTFTYSNTLESEQDDSFMTSYGQYFTWLPKETKVTGIKIPIDEYFSRRYGMTFRTSRSRPLSFSQSVRWGEYYSGRLDGMTSSLSLKLYNRLQTAVSNSYNKMKLIDIDGIQHEINTNILSFYLTYSFSTDLFVRSMTQWNNKDERLLMNFLLRYTYKPGSDLYFVFNETYDAESLMPSIRYRTAVLKFTYLL